MKKILIPLVLIVLSTLAGAGAGIGIGFCLVFVKACSKSAISGHEETFYYGGVFLWVFWIGTAIGAIVGLVNGIKIVNSVRKQEERKRRENDKSEAEARSKTEAEAQRALMAFERRLANVRQNVRDAQLAATRLPLILASADFSLDRAEQELVDDIPSSFWEAMENAALELSEFDSTVENIDNARQRHCELSKGLNSQAPGFSLGVSLLPDTASTGARLKHLYRKAQKSEYSRFAIIYEQRRTTAAVIAGFKSLEQAFLNLGSRLEAGLRSLGSQIEFRLTDIQSALSEAAERNEDQQTALLECAEESRREAATSGAELAVIARESATRAEKDATVRKKYHAELAEMMNNIQRRRRPINPEFRDNTY